MTVDPLVGMVASQNWKHGKLDGAVLVVQYQRRSKMKK